MRGGYLPVSSFSPFRVCDHKIQSDGGKKGISMNHLIRLKTTPPLLITTTLLCLGLLPQAQAVSPAPDGGYPGFNTAEGQKALFSLTTGVGNTAVGWFSLFSNTDGSFNTGVGAGTRSFSTWETKVRATELRIRPLVPERS
jgi:hypothetical protein